ncbi:MAG: hypothetical protein K2J65_11835 [Duncaniella sp.]|nr:hypothetical protein [Duncaniella sp.]
MCVRQLLLTSCLNHDISAIGSMPYFDNAKHEDLIQLLPHKWKEYHLEATMTTSVRQLAKCELRPKGLQLHLLLLPGVAGVPLCWTCDLYFS